MSECVESDPALQIAETKMLAFLLPIALQLHLAQNLPQAPAHPNVGKVSWSCSFEQSYCGMTEQSKVEPQRRSSFTPVARDGGAAVELTTLPGDDQVHSSGTWLRNDLELGPSADYCNEGQQEWWAYSVRFPDDYFVPRGEGVVMDFHGAASGGQPNFSLLSMPYGLRLYGFYGDIHRPDEYKVDLGPLRRNAWYDFVYHVHWTWRDDGFMQVWLNGRKVLDHHGPTLYVGVSCYFKLANYHDPSSGYSSIIFDRVMRGTSADAVALTGLEGLRSPMRLATVAAPAR
jgi:hypothetical protein